MKDTSSVALPLNPYRNFLPSPGELPPIVRREGQGSASTVPPTRGGLCLRITTLCLPS